MECKREKIWLEIACYILKQNVVSAQVCRIGRALQARWTFLKLDGNKTTQESGIEVGPTVINLAFFSRPYGLIRDYIKVI